MTRVDLSKFPLNLRISLTFPISTQAFLFVYSSSCFFGAYEISDEISPIRALPILLFPSSSPCRLHIFILSNNNNARETLHRLMKLENCSLFIFPCPVVVRLNRQTPPALDLFLRLPQTRFGARYPTRRPQTLHDLPNPPKFHNRLSLDLDQCWPSLGNQHPPFQTDAIARLLLRYRSFHSLISASRGKSPVWIPASNGVPTRF